MKNTRQKMPEKNIAKNDTSLCATFHGEVLKVPSGYFLNHFRTTLKKRFWVASNLS